MTDLTPMRIPDLLENAARAWPHRVAIDFMGKTLDFATLWRRVRNLAAGLQAKGLQKGDRVGLMLPNCPAYLEFYFATLLAGGVVVNINPLYAAHELKHILHDSDPRFIVTLDLDQLYSKLKTLSGPRTVIVARMVSQLPPLKAGAFSVLKRKELALLTADTVLADTLMADVPPTPVSIFPTQDLAVLQYTGGTTGVAKAAMLTHANITINAQQCRLHFSKAKDGQEIALAVLPFFHAFALTTLVNLSVYMGTTIIALPRFDLKQVLKTIHKKKPTIFIGVPTIFTAIAHHPSVGKYNLRAVNYCISGGAPLPVEIKHHFEALTGCTLVEGYGLSEASPVVCANPFDGVNKPGSIGIPMPGTQVSLVSSEDKTTPVALGEPGELCVRGPQVMRGYWNHPLETAHALKDGLLYTGDLAKIDEDGYVFIVDRLKDMIICGGYNIYPRNIEEAVYRHDAVEECVCAGVQDSYRGETVKIWVKLKTGKTLTAEDLKLFLKDYLSPIEMPKVIEFRDQPLPKTLIGKLSRKDLLAQEKK